MWASIEPIGVGIDRISIRNALPNFAIDLRLSSRWEPRFTTWLSRKMASPGRDHHSHVQRVPAAVLTGASPSTPFICTLEVVCVYRVLYPPSVFCTHAYT